MNNSENFDDGLTQTNPTEYFIYICHKCKGQVEEKDMGYKCPHCKEWLYYHLDKKKCVLGEKSA